VYTRWKRNVIQLTTKPTECNWAFLQKMPVTQVMHNISPPPPRLSRNPRFTGAFIKPASVPYRQSQEPLNTPNLFSNIHFNIILHLRSGLQSSLFPTGFPTQTSYRFIILPVQAACPAHLVLLDLIILVVCGEKFELWSLSLCSFPHPPVASFLFEPNNLEYPILKHPKSPLFPKFDNPRLTCKH
jgi:hypothetical protein